jgi:uncharacterized membrane protein
MQRLRGVTAVLLLRPVLYLLVGVLTLLLVGCWAVWRVVLVLYEIEDRFSDRAKRE